MALKIEIVNSAYSLMRISGLTVNPTPEDITTALWRLDDMMAELEGTRNICLNYQFEEVSDPSTDTGVNRAANHMMAANLGVRVSPDFGKIVPPTLMAQAIQSMSSVSGMVAADNIRQVQAPRRMPRGSGNTLRFNRWQRFSRPEDLPLNSCASKKLSVGEINDFQESFIAYLGSETIASYTILASAALSIISSSNTTNMINYRIELLNVATVNVHQSVSITITTSSGRIETRSIDFEDDS